MTKFKQDTSNYLTLSREVGISDRLSALKMSTICESCSIFTGQKWIIHAKTSTRILSYYTWQIFDQNTEVWVLLQ